MSIFPTPPSGTSARAMTIPPHAVRPSPVPRGTSALVSAVLADPASADRVWAGVRRLGTPVVEGAGPVRDVTFWHRGEAARVAVVINKLVDDTTYRDALLDRLPGTDLWALTLRLGSGWRGSYALAVDDGAPPRLPEATLAELEQRRVRARSVTDPARHAAVDAWYDLQRHMRPDPLARETTDLGPHGRGGSVGSGPDAPAPRAWPAAPRGRIVPVRHGTRRAWWHVPDADPGPEGWDVLVLLDGDRWGDVHGPGAGAQLDAWAAAGVLRPTATLLLAHGGLAERVADLTCNPALVDDVVALLDASPEAIGAVTRSPERTAIAGQSLGGLTALYAQCVAPDRFGASVCHSGAFWWPNAVGGEPAEWLTRMIAGSGTRLGRVHLEVGTGEWVLLDPTRRLRDVLETRCDAFSYAEFDGGHDAACWEITLPTALAFALGEQRRDGPGQRAGRTADSTARSTAQAPASATPTHG
ncbi:putative esterase [Xylanimonas cellulosilytica DSM 15894]|uniref:Esterase n=1 Tax=Xylanimonas cellulosilytica (strain DSM 15894 / JCM 12276 / CECT 5975 / KCTC 9989 / LMG 20990 / NBRC 107835 / XIL07) TaxID=446471 RepID=D1BRY6_XYLCX|nr:enterochelin esterase domain-containing protein [Xylanimonas cellulosilytica]ACZ30478.1 putative esterase [Xylanimonas cellulosilytica DSM 15894]